jgi:hypothetical protein
MGCERLIRRAATSDRKDESARADGWAGSDAHVVRLQERLSSVGGGGSPARRDWSLRAAEP